MSLFIISWPLFCISFGFMLILSFFMGLQSKRFYTKDVVVKKFSIMDLEMPATARELVNLIKGLYKLPEDVSKRSIRALKGQLYLDFLFMPCAYGSIFIICMLVSGKMQMSFGMNVFSVLAWLQIVPWICDIIENIYLLRKIKPDPVLSSDAVHKAYLIMEGVKWSIALIATVCAVTAICYFWLSGHYAIHSLYFLLAIIIEVVVFILLGKLFLKKMKYKI